MGARNRTTQTKLGHSNDLVWDWVTVLILSVIMDKALEKNSGILLLKSKFFLYRVVSYFSFLLIPVLIPKAVDMEIWAKGVFMGLYICFMIGQWFLLGKEIDHRLKIYFRVNSSIDRIVYRVHLGMFFMVLYFNMLSVLPSKWIYNFFWITWVLLGLFYSWPTRGKIIQESVTTNFSEFKYLDRFEKTLVFLISVLMLVTFTQIPEFSSPNSLKLFYDPDENFSPVFWNFLTVNYYPFMKYPELLKLAWSFHFYFIGIGLYLIALYALLRYFVSRRSSILGIFALLSSWSVTKILVDNPAESIVSTYSLLWVWTILWVIKSSTYRSGLFLGLVNFWGFLVAKGLVFLYLVQAFVLNYFLGDKTIWFRRQTAKYTLAGLAAIIITVIAFSDFQLNFLNFEKHIFENFKTLLFRKSFFILAPFGLVFLLAKFLDFPVKFLNSLKIEKERIKEIGICVFSFYLVSFLFDSRASLNFSFLWLITLFSLIPIELIFQSMTRLRSSRNMVYLIYILICLLDSHFEGRIKIFLRMFNSF